MKVLDNSKLTKFVSYLTTKLDIRYDERYNDKVIDEQSIKNMISRAITKYSN